jgi:hypothetical protein
MDQEKIIIAHEQLIAISKITGERITVHINIYQPKVLPNAGSLTQAECMGELIGLYERIAPALALTTFGALSIACDSIKVLLEYKRKLFDFYYPDSGENYFESSAPRIAV